jgi:CheY-like chemotaxis protein
MADKKTVLVVDDDQDIRAQVSAALGPNYRVVTGASGKECLALAAAERPDVIVLDVMMSHMADGLDCLKTLKTGGATRHIPVIMLTGVNQVYDYRSQIDESFYTHDKWLEKPVKPAEILAAVREILAKR